MHHRGASLSEQCIAGSSWHTNHALLVTPGIITACMSAVPWAWWAKLHGAKQHLYLVRTIVLTRYRWSVRTSTTATQTLGLNFTLKSWAESLALMSVDYAWPTELPEDSLVSSLLSVKGYCQSAVSAWKIPGAKTTQINARMVTADHDRQGQAGHTRYKLCAVVEFARSEDVPAQSLWNI